MQEVQVMRSIGVRRMAQPKMREMGGKMNGYEPGQFHLFQDRFLILFNVNPLDRMLLCARV